MLKMVHIFLAMNDFVCVLASPIAFRRNMIGQDHPMTIRSYHDFFVAFGEFFWSQSCWWYRHYWCERAVSRLDSGLESVSQDVNWAQGGSRIDGMRLGIGVFMSG